MDFSASIFAALSLGSVDPNHPAALLVTFIPSCWVLERLLTLQVSRKNFALLVWVIECIMTVLALLTCSASALVGSLAGLAIFAIGLTRDAAAPGKLLRDFLGYRLLLIGGVVAITTVLGNSVLSRESLIWSQRAEVWQGALQLLVASPAQGWGSGQSALAFMQWVQNPGHDLTYSTLWNSYLQLAADHGAAALGVSLFILLLPATFFFKLGSRQRSLTGDALSACAAGLGAFAAASVFSTLWLHQEILWAPASLLIIGLILSVRRRGWLALRDATIVASLGAIAVTGVLYLTAFLAGHAPAWQLQRFPDGRITLTRENGRNTERMLFLPDRLTLGPYYGREIRLALSRLGDGFDQAIICPPGIPAVCDGMKIAFLFGPRIKELSTQVHSRTKIVVVHPAAPVNEAAAWHPSFVILPEYDESQFSPQWVRWANEHQTAVNITSGFGQYLAPQWMEVFRHSLERAGK